MNINVTLTEADIKRLILRELKELTGIPDLKESDVSIKVKSKQNYKSEWEEAAFKAEIDRIV